MMEQPDAGKSHGNTVFVADGNNLTVPYRTAGLCHVFYPLLYARSILYEGKKRRSQGNPVMFFRNSLFLGRQAFGLDGKVVLQRPSVKTSSS